MDYRTSRTQFLPDLPATSGRALCYYLSRHHLGGAPLFRWIVLLLLVTAVLALVGLIPGRWWSAGSLLLLVVVLTVARSRLSRRNFVRFQEEPQPSLSPAKLDPADKVAVYGTGLFSVEGKSQQFSVLPGYFRTFATREHAVLCLARDRRFLRLARWPLEDVGMWYIFFEPGMIESIRWGTIWFDGQAHPGLCVDYRLTIPPRNRLSREQVQIEQVYLSCVTEADARLILADLMADRAESGDLPQ